MMPKTIERMLREAMMTPKHPRPLQQGQQKQKGMYNIYLPNDD
jgi:hypothetical protein